MAKYKNVIALCLGFVFVLSTIRYLTDTETVLKKMEYAGSEGKTQFTTNAKIIGAKKVGAAMLWINQVLSVGEQVGSYEDAEKVADVPLMIKNNSEEISNLDPYFLGNYYFSAPIVALIRIYNRYDYGIEILKRGIEYNSEDPYLKMYMAGIIGDYKGDEETKLAAFEEIAKGVRDDMIMDTLAFAYEKKYKKTKDQEYLNKAGIYWQMLIDSKDAKYAERARKKLNEYFNIEF